MGKHMAFGHHQAFKHEELLTLLKMDEQALKEELKAGKSLVEIATTKGVTKEQLVDALIKEANKHIDQKVEDGKLTEEQAKEFKTNLSSHITETVEVKGVFQKGKGHKKGHMKGHHFKGEKMSELASILDMSVEEIHTAIKSGKSIAQIAKEKGLSEDKLINALLEKEKERISEWVKEVK
jgi:DNA-binding phage protein